jgi:hypothetical protein
VRHGARQRPKNARQSLCRAFLVGAHGKEHTVAICTVNSHCRAPYITRHGELCLSCVTGRRTAKKSNSRCRPQTAWKDLCRAPRAKTHGKGTVPDGGNSAFAVRLHLDARQTFSKKNKKKPKPLPGRPRLECLHTNHCMYR